MKTMKLVLVAIFAVSMFASCEQVDTLPVETTTNVSSQATNNYPVVDYTVKPGLNKHLLEEVDCLDCEYAN